MKRSSYVSFGNDEDRFVFVADKKYNANNDIKNAYLHIRGNTDENYAIKTTPKQLRSIADKLLKLAERLESNK